MAGALQLDAIVEGPSAVLGWPPSGPIHPHGIAKRLNIVDVSGVRTGHKSL
jgi:hypothetical protein